jgi:hypothetical protein
MYSKGRPSKVPKENIVNTILAYKNRVILLDKIVSKHEAVWSEISIALSGHLTPASLYSIVSCNRFNVRDKLLNRENANATINESDLSYSSSNMNDTTSSKNSTLNNSRDKQHINFTIMVSICEFEDLIVLKSYKRTIKNKVRNRIWRTLRPGIWEEFITNKIWDVMRLKCGFRFRNHYLSNNGPIAGYINGKYF